MGPPELLDISTLHRAQRFPSEVPICPSCKVPEDECTAYGTLRANRKETEIIS